MDRSYKYAFGSMVKGEQQFSWKIGRALTTTAGTSVENFFSIPQGADLNAPVESRDEPGTILGTNITDDFQGPLSELQRLSAGCNMPSPQR